MDKKRKFYQKMFMNSIKSMMANKNLDWDDVMLMSPRKGKSSWTCREIYTALENDTCLEGMSENYLDDSIRSYERLQEYRKNKK